MNKQSTEPTVYRQETTVYGGTGTDQLNAMVNDLEYNMMPLYGRRKFKQLTGLLFSPCCLPFAIARLVGHYGGYCEPTKIKGIELCAFSWYNCKDNGCSHTGFENVEDYTAGAEGNPGFSRQTLDIMTIICAPAIAAGFIVPIAIS